MSKTLTHLKDGVMADFDRILAEEGVDKELVKNIAESQYCLGKSTIKFVGADNEGRVTGPMQHITYINEGNFVSEKVAEQLSIRTTKCIFVDQNPSCDSWVDAYHDKESAVTIHSTYRDNDFLSEAQVEDLLDRGKRNAFFQRVYIDGLKGRLEGAVYSNWEEGAFDTSLPYGYGMDFGFKDPDVLIKCAIDNKRKLLYLHEEFRDEKLSTDALINRLKQYKGMIYADSAEPRLINDIRGKGVMINAVKKGAGSIVAGIRLMQGYKIIVTSSSKQLIRELETYVWSDKRGGIPEDKNNHGLDAARYFVRMNNLGSNFSISFH